MAGEPSNVAGVALGDFDLALVPFGVAGVALTALGWLL